MNALWLVMLIVGLLTFVTRLSFILLFEHWQPPKIVQRGLRYVPVAVLTAILVPEIMLVNGRLAVTPANPRLMAGLIASFVAWKTKSTLLTIASGMVVYSLIYLVF